MFKRNLVPEKNLDLKLLAEKILPTKNLGSKKMFEKNLGQNKFLVQKFFWSIQVQNNFESKRILGSKKSCIQKKLGPRPAWLPKILISRKFGI